MWLTPSSLGILATMGLAYLVERSMLPESWKVGLVCVLIWGIPASLWFLN